MRNSPGLSHTRGQHQAGLKEAVTPAQIGLKRGSHRREGVAVPERDRSPVAAAGKEGRVEKGSTRNVLLGCCEPGRLAVRLAELEDVVFFEPTGLITPLPLLGQVDGKLLARPVRKGFS